MFVGNSQKIRVLEKKNQIKNEKHWIKGQEEVEEENKTKRRGRKPKGSKEKREEAKEKVSKGF